MTGNNANHANFSFDFFILLSFNYWKKSLNIKANDIKAFHWYLKASAGPGLACSNRISVIRTPRFCWLTVISRLYLRAWSTTSLSKIVCTPSSLRNVSTLKGNRTSALLHWAVEHEEKKKVLGIFIWLKIRPESLRVREKLPKVIRLHNQILPQIARFGLKNR